MGVHPFNHRIREVEASEPREFEACGSQKKASDFLELELQAIVDRPYE